MNSDTIDLKAPGETLGNMKQVLFHLREAVKKLAADPLKTTDPANWNHQMELLQTGINKAEEDIGQYLAATNENIRILHERGWSTGNLLQDEALRLVGFDLEKIESIMRFNGLLTAATDHELLIGFKWLQYDHPAARSDDVESGCRYSYIFGTLSGDRLQITFDDLRNPCIRLPFRIHAKYGFKKGRDTECSDGSFSLNVGCLCFTDRTETFGKDLLSCIYGIKAERSGSSLLGPHKNEDTPANIVLASFISPEDVAGLKDSLGFASASIKCARTKLNPVPVATRTDLVANPS